MRQTRPWETITFYIGAEKGVKWEEIIPSELKTKAPPPHSIDAAGKEGILCGLLSSRPLGIFHQAGDSPFLDLVRGIHLLFGCLKQWSWSTGG